MATKDRLAYRQTKDNPTVVADITKIALKLDRSVNYVVEQALIAYIKKNKK